jgi:hypothetical protein
MLPTRKQVASVSCVSRVLLLWGVMLEFWSERKNSHARKQGYRMGRSCMHLCALAAAATRSLLRSSNVSESVPAVPHTGPPQTPSDPAQRTTEPSSALQQQQP